MEANKIIHNCFLNNTLPDKCANLIIADPPYYKVKGEFDFKWETFADYLADVERWAQECKRLLADNGTLFWWGHAKKIAYSQIVLDKYFCLENSMLWEKIDSMQYQYYSAENSRTFNTHNERVLVYSNEVLRTGLEEIKLDMENFKPLRSYFKSLYGWIGISKSEILTRIGQRADHCFRWGSSQWDMPTPETYGDITNNFNARNYLEFKEYEDLRKEYEDLRKEYEDLRKEYEDLRRPFNNVLKLTDVLRFSQEGHETKKHDHPTKKPPKLTAALINTCSRPGDLVVVPFSGSGTECAMAAKYGRPFIGYDTKLKYVEMGQRRANAHLNQLSLV